MFWEPVTDTDRKTITRQLQREPRQIKGVACRCRQGCPRVVVNAPVVDAADPHGFFPTVFWLTCPEASRRIHRIEDQGYIQRIQEQLQASVNLSENMKSAHEEYIYIRRTLVSPALRQRLRESHPPLVRSLEQAGIGGLADWKGVKCLHMHYAHYLVTRRNPVGYLLEQMLQWDKEPWHCQQCQLETPKTAVYAGVAE